MCIIRNSKTVKHCLHFALFLKLLLALLFFYYELFSDNKQEEIKTEIELIIVDDPISSLDSNHIFFVYSLINAEIFATQEFEQIFISTHNLDFLKYLKRIQSSKERSYFLISRENEKSKKFVIS